VILLHNMVLRAMRRIAVAQKSGMLTKMQVFGLEEIKRFSEAHMILGHPHRRLTVHTIRTIYQIIRHHLIPKNVSFPITNALMAG